MLWAEMSLVLARWSSLQRDGAVSVLPTVDSQRLTIRPKSSVFKAPVVRQAVDFW